MIDKADVEESTYVVEHPTKIRPLKAARLDIIKMLMQPWFGGKMIPEEKLRASLSVLDIPREDKKAIEALMQDYLMFNGLLVWKKKDLPKLQKLVQAVMGIKNSEISAISDAEGLIRLVSSKIKKLQRDRICDICFVLTSVE
jgi:hypothetical protein